MLLKSSVWQSTDPEETWWILRHFFFKQSGQRDLCSLIISKSIISNISKSSEEFDSHITLGYQLNRQNIILGKKIEQQKTHKKKNEMSMWYSQKLLFESLLLRFLQKELWKLSSYLFFTASGSLEGLWYISYVI